MQDDEKKPESQGEQEDQGDGKPKTDWQAEARKWEGRAKENKSAAAELKKLRESQMSELEKAQEEAAAARREAEELKAEKDRSEWVRDIAKSTGVPADVLRSLAATSKEDLAERAESIKEHFARETVPVVIGDGKRPDKTTSEKQEFARELFGR